MKKTPIEHKKDRKLRDWWRRLYDSTKLKMSRGAREVNSIITWARADNWRRKEKKK